MYFLCTFNNKLLHICNNQLVSYQETKNRKNNQMSKTEKNVYVKITPEINSLTIDYNVRILSKKKPSGYSCYLPGFNIYFFAKDDDTMLKKAELMSRFYFDHFMKFTPKQGLKRLVLDLNKKGFKAENNMSTIQNLINNRVVKANFKAPDFKVHQDFRQTSEINVERKFAIA